jgi:mTERF domain-containing protein
LLKNHGFSQTQILNIVKSRAKLLICNPEDALFPKLDFFNSIGLSCSDIAKHPLLLVRGLKNHIIPTFSFLKGLVKSDEKTVVAINRYPFVRTLYCERDMASRANLWRENGVLESNIVKLVYYCPRVFSMNLIKSKTL